MYELAFCVMIFFFAYFWNTVQFQPKDFSRHHGENSIGTLADFVRAGIHCDTIAVIGHFDNDRGLRDIRAVDRSSGAGDKTVRWTVL